MSYVGKQLKIVFMCFGIPIILGVIALGIIGAVILITLLVSGG